MVGPGEYHAKWKKYEYLTIKRALLPPIPQSIFRCHLDHLFSWLRFFLLTYFMCFLPPCQEIPFPLFYSFHENPDPCVPESLSFACSLAWCEITQHHGVKSLLERSYSHPVPLHFPLWPGRKAPCVSRGARPVLLTAQNVLLHSGICPLFLDSTRAPASTPVSQPVQRAASQDGCVRHDSPQAVVNF